MDGLLKRVQAGDPIQIGARTWNAVLEETRRSRIRRGAGSPGADDDATAGRLMVRVRNDSGVGNQSPGAVLQLATPLSDPTVTATEFAGVPAFSGITPTSTAAIVAVADAGYPADGTLNRGTVMGVCRCRVLVNDPTHTRARPVVGETRWLDSAADGPAVILWRAGVPVGGASESDTGSGSGPSLEEAVVLLCCNTGVPVVGPDPDWSGSGSGSGVEDYIWAGCCGGSLPIPGRFYLNLVNKTGNLTCIEPNSLEFLAADGTAPSSSQRLHSATFSAGTCFISPATFSAGVTWSCVGGTGGTTYTVAVSFTAPVGVPDFADRIDVLGSGSWTGSGFFRNFGATSAARACGADPFAEEEPVGTVRLWSSVPYSGSVIGTMDLVLSR